MQILIHVTLCTHNIIYNNNNNNNNDIKYTINIHASRNESLYEQ